MRNGRATRGLSSDRLACCPEGGKRQDLTPFTRSDPVHPFTTLTPFTTYAQWKLFCLVHNIEKLAHHGYAQ